MNEQIASLVKFFSENGTSNRPPMLDGQFSPSSLVQHRLGSRELVLSSTWATRLRSSWALLAASRSQLTR